MSKYKVIKSFVDLSDNSFFYNVGDEYPREGSSPTNERVEELKKGTNLTSQIFIKEVEADKKGPEVKKTPEDKKEKVVTPESKKK